MPRGYVYLTLEVLRLKLFWDDIIKDQTRPYTVSHAWQDLVLPIVLTSYPSGYHTKTV
jgi:hypothetical protein